MWSKAYNEIRSPEANAVLLLPDGYDLVIILHQSKAEGLEDFYSPCDYTNNHDNEARRPGTIYGPLCREVENTDMHHIFE